MERTKRNIKSKLTFFIVLIAFISLLYLASSYVTGSLFPLKYQDTIARYSAQYDLDPYLVLAVIKTESNFRPGAVSPKDARGLMQITTGTGKWVAGKLKLEDYTDDMLYDAETNILIGCRYLYSLYKEFGETDLVLAAYNGGSGNVSQWLKDSKYSKDGIKLDKIPFKETENYVIKVKKSYSIYKKLYENVF